METYMFMRTYYAYMNGELPQGETKRGKLVALAPETIDAMRKMRSEGKNVKEVCDFFHVSAGTVSKYCPAKPEVNASEETTPGTTYDIDEKVQKNVLKEHVRHILEIAKEKDADQTHAGASVEEYLREHNVNLDLRRIPKDQVVAIIKGIGGYNTMDPQLKESFDKWLSDKLSPASPAPGNTGKISFEDIKEMMFLNFLAKMGMGDNSQGNDSVNKLIVENEKLRQFFEGKFKDQEDRIKEMVFEKKIQTLEEKQVDFASDLSSQLEGLQQSIVQIKAVPNPTPEQKNVLEEATKAASDLNKLKTTLIQLGLVSAAPGAVAQSPDMAGLETFRNPDGSLNTVALGLVKGADALKAFIEAKAKQTPEPGEFVETPAPARQEPQYTERRMSEEEYAEFLLSRSGLTPEQQQWLTNYRNYLLQYHPTAQPEAAPLGQIPEKKPEEQPAVQPEPAQDLPEAVKPVQPADPIIERPAETVGIVEKLRAAEEQRNRALEGMI